jgi:hypothetical protein
MKAGLLQLGHAGIWQLAGLLAFVVIGAAWTRIFADPSLGRASGGGKLP